MTQSREETTVTVERAISVAKRLYELHERGPIGQIEAHRIARTAFATCPACAELLTHTPPPLTENEAPS